MRHLGTVQSIVHPCFKSPQPPKRKKLRYELIRGLKTEVSTELLTVTPTWVSETNNLGPCNIFF